MVRIRYEAAEYFDVLLRVKWILQSTLSTTRRQSISANFISYLDVVVEWYAKTNVDSNVP